MASITDATPTKRYVIKVEAGAYTEGALTLKANVFIVDIKEEQDMPEKYKVVMIPTQIFFDAQGKEVKRHMGFMNKNDIMQVFRILGVK